MDLKVINEITTEIKNFKSIEEFNLYYQKHKDDMNNQTTQYLNRVYKIVTPDGVEYRITKKNCQKEGTKRVGGDIFLKKVVKTNELKELEQDVIKADIENLKNELTACQSMMTNKVNIEQYKQTIDCLNNHMDEIDKKINELKSTVNQIAKYINQQMLND